MSDINLSNLSGTSSSGSANPIPYASSSVSGSVNTDIGKVSVGASDLGGSALKSAGNLTAGFIGMGKGIVSLAENLPIIGGITKPLIGFTGGILDATLGTVVRAAEGFKVGDSNLAQATVGALETVGTPLKWGLDALSAPGQFVQNEVAKARLQSYAKGSSNDFIRIFPAPEAAAIKAVQNGASIEEAALKLVESNAAFTPDGAQNFLWSLVIDPINLIAPGAGKALAIGAKASEFTKFIAASSDAAIAAAKAGGRLEEVTKLTEASQFIEKWGWAGKVYDQTVGALKGKMGLLAPKYATEITRAIWRVHPPKIVNDVLDTVTLFSGGGRANAERGLRNVAITAAGAVRSGVVRAVSSIRRMNSDNLAKSTVSYFEGLIRGGADNASILTEKLEQQTVSIGEIMTKSGIAPEKQNEFLNLIRPEIKNGTRADELLRTEAVQNFISEFAKGHNNWYVRDRAGAMRATSMIREHLDARIGAEQATKIFSDAKIEQVPVAQGIIAAVGRGESIESAASGLIKDLVNGFGMQQKDAVQAAITLVKKHSADINSLADALSIARSANYGRRVEGLALIRAKIAERIQELGDKANEKFGRVTLISARTLTEADISVIEKKVAELRAAEAAAIEAGDDAAAAAAREGMKNLADEVVYKFDDASANFAPKTVPEGIGSEAQKLAGQYGYDDVFKWVKAAKGNAVQSITSDELNLITKLAKTEKVFKDLLDYIDELTQADYRLGFAPKSGVVEASTLRHLSDGGEAWQNVLLPFVDTLDVTDIAKLDKGLEGINLKPSRLESIMDMFTRKYGAETTRANTTERFITSLVGKTGISVRKAREILSNVNSKAAELNKRPQALFLENSIVEEIFSKSMTPTEYRRLVESGSTPIKEIISAAAGDYRVAGLTSGFTGRVKAIAPAITIMTDIIWGESRFGRLNPYFNLILERIETQFQLVANNIWKKVSDQFANENVGTVLLRNMRDRANFTSEFADGMVYHLRRRTEAVATIAEQAPGFRNSAGRIIQRLRTELKNAKSIDHVRIVKQAARDMMADRYAAGQVIELLNKARPDIFNELAIHYGVTKADDVMELVLGEMIMQSEPALMKELIARQGGVARTLTGEAIRDGIAESLVKTRGMTKQAAAQEATRLSNEIANAVVGAYEIAIERGSRAADQAQYFASYRSWFERSINHPFLALYPYSYMTQKAIPSMMKMLFLTPGPRGVLMPGWGYVKYQQVAEYMNDQANTNNGFLGQLLNSEPAMLLMGSLLPTSAEDMGFGFTTALRQNIIQPGFAGQDVTLNNLSNSLNTVKDTVWNGSLPGQAGRVLNVGNNLGQDINLNQGIENAVTQGIPGIIQNVAPQIQESLLGNLRNP